MKHETELRSEYEALRRSVERLGLELGLGEEGGEKRVAPSVIIQQEIRVCGMHLDKIEGLLGEE